MRIFLILALLTVTALTARPVRAQDTVPEHQAETLLSALVGQWRMVGQVQGQPVEYALLATRTLAGRYLEFHMIDVASPPGYEARVFIGADSVAGRVLVHWLDSFGAASSIPHGSGRINGDTLRFEFAYPSGPFRDTIVLDRAADTWLLTLEAGDGRGQSQNFASYRVQRAAR